jgi:putative hemolysin
MLELVHSASSFTNPPTTTTTGSGLVVGLAQTNQELELIQRLRYDTFKSEFGAAFNSGAPGVDSDAFDEWCQHLMVRDVGTDEVIGTYRVLTPENARRAGSYYSESEFNLSGLGDIRAQLVEFGLVASYRGLLGQSPSTFENNVLNR